ncbi:MULTISPECIES: DUF2188 domain-containing protein [unclassified Cupriavidus]|uniref:DUF2188 domain-containing protein n=1 Tax=unclassified Cupriavidus TaxID=2640874 RepID=UPI001AE7173F|nr:MULTISPECIES: DUF2188 domain-containing protein [unclassified Cupriavidus]MBP0630817.1 DUF2188 domain-containing protein [Cupriavidus sp. AcVe19-1a]MBP0638769.1 DUF2188 domain-containing protein [Cupriavidus sp. AcVe19-6a]
MSSTLNILVMPAHLGWTVWAEDRADVYRFLGSLNEAIETAIDIAKLEKAELAVYGLDGRIRMRRSFIERTSEAPSFSQTRGENVEEASDRPN